MVPACGAPVTVEVHDVHEVSEPLHHCGPAFRAECVVGTLHQGVAHVHVVQSAFHADPPASQDRLDRRPWDVHHLVVGVETGEMDGNILGEVLHDPSAETADLVLRIVVSRYDQVCELQVHALFEHYLRGPQDIIEMGSADLHVEIVGESLDVYVHGVGDLAEFPEGFLADQSVGDQDQVKVRVLPHDVHDVLEPDHRLVVGERDDVQPLAPAQRHQFVGPFVCGPLLSR